MISKLLAYSLMLGKTLSIKIFSTFMFFYIRYNHGAWKFNTIIITFFSNPSLIRNIY